MEHRFNYSIVGHSGDSSRIRLVDFDDHPRNPRDKLKVLKTIVAHSQFCSAGDNTLEAMERALSDISKSSHGDTDECIVILISDANLSRYDIHPSELGGVMGAGGSR